MSNLFPSSKETAQRAKRMSGRTFVTLVTGGRVEPVKKDEGTYVRGMIATARKKATGILNAINGAPKRDAASAEWEKFFLEGSEMSETPDSEAAETVTE